MKNCTSAEQWQGPSLVCEGMSGHGMNWISTCHDSGHIRVSVAMVTCSAYQMDKYIMIERPFYNI